METDFCGPSLPPRFNQSVQADHGTLIFSLNTRILNPNTRNKLKGCVLLKPRNTRTKKKHKVQAKYFTSQSSSSEEDQSAVTVKKSAKSLKAPSEQDQQDNPDPVFYREVDMSDLPSQYTEEVETFRYILDLPNPRETMPRSSTIVAMSTLVTILRY